MGLGFKLRGSSEIRVRWLPRYIDGTDPRVALYLVRVQGLGYFLWIYSFLTVL